MTDTRFAPMTRVSLQEKLARTLQQLEEIADAETNTNRKAHMLARYAETLIRAIDVLYPQTKGLEITARRERAWEELTPAQRLAELESAQERLTAITEETRQLAAGRTDT